MRAPAVTPEFPESFPPPGEPLEQPLRARAVMALTAAMPGRSLLLRFMLLPPRSAAGVLPSAEADVSGVAAVPVRQDLEAEGDAVEDESEEDRADDVPPRERVVAARHGRGDGAADAVDRAAEVLRDEGGDDGERGRDPESGEDVGAGAGQGDGAGGLPRGRRVRPHEVAVHRSHLPESAQGVEE